MEAVILLTIGVILVVFNVKAVVKEKSSFEKQLDEKRESISDIDLKIEKVRSEFQNKIFELQKEIEDMNEKQRIEPLNHKEEENKDDNKKNDKIENYNNVKIDEIRSMLDQSMSMDEISEKTGIGKGELLLIKELYIK